MGDAFLRVRRLASLLEQLEEEDGRYGAKTRSAQAVGLSQSYASKIRAGHRINVSDAVIERAARSLDLREEFFTAPGPDDLDYREYVGGPTVDAWDAWLASSGSDVTVEEARILQSMAAAAEGEGTEVTPALLSGLLIALRMHRLGATKR